MALATAFGVRRSDVGVVAGHRSRDKVVEIRGNEDPLRARLAVLLG